MIDLQVPGEMPFGSDLVVKVVVKARQATVDVTVTESNGTQTTLSDYGSNPDGEVILYFRFKPRVSGQCTVTAIASIGRRRFSANAKVLIY